MRSGELHQLHPPGGYVPRRPEGLPAHPVQRAIDQAGNAAEENGQAAAAVQRQQNGGHVMALDYLI